MTLAAVPDAEPAVPDAEPERPDLGDRLAVSPREAARLLGVSVPTIYELLGSGRVHSVKVGTRRLVSVAALRAFVDRSDEEDP